MSEFPDKDFKAANIKNKTKTQNDHLSTYLKLKKIRLLQLRKTTQKHDC